MIRAFNTVLILGLFLCLPFGAMTQKDYMTQDDVNLQSKFIDAEKYILLAEYEKAFNILETLESQLPESAAVRYLQAKVTHAQKQPEQALEYIEAAIQIEPGNEWYVQYKANIAEAYDRYDVASESYQRLVEMNPDRTNYYKNWSFYELRLGNRDAAIEILNTLEDKIGITADVSRKKHKLYAAGGDAKRAVRELQKLSGAYPQNVDYLHELADFYTKINNLRKAEKVYEQILLIDPDDPKAAVQQAVLASGDDETDSPTLTLLRLAGNPNIDLDEKIPEIIPYVHEFSKTKDSTLGRDLLSISAKLAETHPPSPKLDALEGDILYQMGLLEDAIEAYQRSVEAYDGVYPVWEQLMYALYESGDYDQLDEVSGKALDLFPNKASAYYLRGRAFEYQSAYEQALRLSNRGILVAARNKYQQAELHNLKGDILIKLGRKEEAVRSWKQSIETGYRLSGVDNKIEQYSTSN